MLETGGPTASPPGWIRVAPYLGTPPGLSSRQWRVFGLLIIAAIFNQYDIALLQLALPQIQAGFGLQEAELGRVVAIIRLGSIPAFLLLASADWLGRRRVLLWTIIGYTLATAATAFVTSINGFIAAQFIARLFISAEIALSVVFITEEFPTDARGWGVGAFMALASYGFAIAAMVFALIEVVPYGWRLLYLLGVGPLTLIIYLRRNLPETRHFAALATGRSDEPSAHAPESAASLSLQANWTGLWSLVRRYPQRLALLAGVVLLVSLGGDPALFFDPTYLQTGHGWQPWQISLLTLGAGMVALFGSAYAGRLGDRWGRKRAVVLFILGGVVAILFFYNLWGWWLPVFWAAMLFAFRGIQVTLAAFGAELFPTAVRGSATGIQTATSTVGGATGLALHGLIAAWLGAPWQAVSLLALVMPLALVFLAYLPETKGHQLSKI